MNLYNYVYSYFYPINENKKLENQIVENQIIDYDVLNTKNKLIILD